MLFGCKGTCILQKVMYPLAPTQKWTQAGHEDSLTAHKKTPILAIGAKRRVWFLPCLEEVLGGVQDLGESVVEGCLGLRRTGCSWFAAKEPFGPI